MCLYWLRVCNISVHNHTHILYSYCTCTICYIYLSYTIANGGPKVLVARQTHCFTTHHSFKHARQPFGCIKNSTLSSFNAKTDVRSFTPHQSLGRILTSPYHPLLTRYCASIPKMVDITPQISHCPPGGFKSTTIAPPSLRDGLEEEASCINLSMLVPKLWDGVPRQ